MAFVLQFINRGLAGADGEANALLGTYLVPFLEPLYSVQVCPPCQSDPCAHVVRHAPGLVCGRVVT